MSIELGTLSEKQLNKLTVKTRRLSNFKGDVPRYQSALASGFDVRAQLETPMLLEPGQRALIPTGLSFEIPAGFELQARPRSGWAAKQGMTLLNSPGTIDADYRGEVKIIAVNLGGSPVEVRDQDRIAQLVLCPVWQAELVVADELSETGRGSGGFGSTGLSGNA
jgi:dUTP pyrophosphatase